LSRQETVHGLCSLMVRMPPDVRLCIMICRPEPRRADKVRGKSTTILSHEFRHRKDCPRSRKSLLDESHPVAAEAVP